LSKKCQICGANSRGDRCFKHKQRKPIAKTALKRKPPGTKRQRQPAGTGRPKSIKKLKHDLYTIFSKYIRLRDSDHRGVGKCITCDNKEYWKYADSGHYIRRKHMSTFVDERNNNLQCKTCNQVRNPEEMEAAYRIAIDKKHGPGTAEELEAMKHQTKRFSVPELVELISHYTREFEKLLKSKKDEPIPR